MSVISPQKKILPGFCQETAPHLTASFPTEAEVMRAPFFRPGECRNQALRCHRSLSRPLLRTRYHTRHKSHRTQQPRAPFPQWPLLGPAGAPLRSGKAHFPPLLRQAGGSPRRSTRATRGLQGKPNPPAYSHLTGRRPLPSLTGFKRAHPS